MEGWKANIGPSAAGYVGTLLQLLPTSNTFIGISALTSYDTKKDQSNLLSWHLQEEQSICYLEQGLTNFLQRAW